MGLPVEQAIEKLQPASAIYFSMDEADVQRILEESGLVSSEKIGRVRTCKIEPRALQATEAWIRQHVLAWEKRLDRLEARWHFFGAVSLHL